MSFGLPNFFVIHLKNYLKIKHIKHINFQRCFMNKLTVKKLKISLIIHALSDNSHFIIKSRCFFLFFLHFLSPICFKCWLNFKKTSELSQVIPKSKESHFPLSQRIKMSKLLYSLYIGVILKSIFATTILSENLSSRLSMLLQEKETH